MSYILDALKKSEQVRGHGNIPSVQTVHSSSLNYRNDKNTYWPYVLICAVILNISVVLYFIFDREQPATNQADITPNSAKHDDYENNIAGDNTAADTEVTEDTATKPLAIDKNIASENITPASAPIVTADAEHTGTAPAAKNRGAVDAAKSEHITGNPTKADIDIIDFYDLPESIKQQLPTIVISAHVYSSNPLQRSVVINNNFMEEGEYVLDHLVLHEITAGGVIFDYHATRFSYPVISSWQ